MAAQLKANEFYRVNSYFWQGLVYIVLETKDDKCLCQIKGSKADPKWIKKSQFSKTYRDFSTED